MSRTTQISWCHSTFNAWIGCTKVSAGCANCYAETQDRFRHWTPEGWGQGKPRKRNWQLNGICDRRFAANLELQQTIASQLNSSLSTMNASNLVMSHALCMISDRVCHNPAQTAYDALAQANRIQCFAGSSHNADVLPPGHGRAVGVDVVGFMPVGRDVLFCVFSSNDINHKM